MAQPDPGSRAPASVSSEVTVIGFATLLGSYLSGVVNSAVVGTVWDTAVGGPGPVVAMAIVLGAMLFKRMLYDSGTLTP